MHFIDYAHTVFVFSIDYFSSYFLFTLCFFACLPDNYNTQTKKKEKKKTTLLFLTYDKTNILMRYAKAVDSFLLINNKQQNKKN